MVRSSNGDFTRIMGSFNKCMEETKRAVHLLLEGECRNLIQMMRRANQMIEVVANKK
jgi:hypothetical protein